MQPLNTTPEVMVAQAERNLARNLPVFVEHQAHGGRVCIVGGAPSLAETLPKLRYQRNYGGIVVALNNTHDWLIERGIYPDMHVMLDARAENADFVRKPCKGVTYLMAAQCHPDVFDALSGQEVIVWVADVPGMRELADRTQKPLGLVGGGSTVGLKAMALMYLWGFREMALFGMDSCYREVPGQCSPECAAQHLPGYEVLHIGRYEHHAYPQALNDGESRVETVVNGKRFICAPWMIAQAEDFDHDARGYIARGVSIKAYGSGLIQTLLDQIKESEHAAA